MSKLTWKPGTLLAPLPPVMVSCGGLSRPNIITVAWTGIVNSDPAMTYVSIRPERHSYGLIKDSGEFVINLTTKALVWAADWCGVKSGRDVDKFAKQHLTPEKASEVEAPLIAESPLNLECRVEQVIPLGTHHMFLSRIVAVDVDPKLLDAKGMLRLEKAGLVVYSHGEYFALGRQLGTFGCSVRKK